ncbi:DUF4279 domain-containing protein [Thauera butanivorans]|uniref:DUF4279 domain-containing protein n=1 Tax=Thauera butanivorans TaxID=86174 RepID=UPI0012F9B2DC|nr:DUF4279 domain-containing protein [Thauera butanivorans]
MSSFCFDVSLRLFSQNFSPDEMVAEIGLKPRWKNLMGDRRKTPKGLPLEGVYEINYCAFPILRQKDEELHEMLDRIVDDLSSQKDFFLVLERVGGV